MDYTIKEHFFNTFLLLSLIIKLGLIHLYG
jgi:hypothetical protein